MNSLNDLSIQCALKFYYKLEGAKLALEDEAMLFPLAYKEKIGAYAKEYSLDPWIIISLTRQESLFDPKALSHAQAYGLMQIIPETGYRLAKQLIPADYFRPEDLYDPNTNLNFGCFYFRQLLDKFDQNIVYAIAAYNGGAGSVSSWIKRFDKYEIDAFIENIPFGETRDYVKRILRNFWMYYRIYDQEEKMEKKRLTEYSRFSG